MTTLIKTVRSLKRKYSNFEDYNKQFIISDDEFDTFTDRAISEEIVFTEEEMLSNSNFVKIQLKALIARNLYEVDDYFEVISPVDPEIIKALEVINDNDIYKRLISNN